ncbi:YjbF family lipoprotein [Paenirhodobacter populi]|uniref:YjbF family lipoprotein n=1 Tax=Paenirhodobacter populi TaxID=2306993 RepID=A0A443KJ42_9RHOB|nr:YjbF family lipoprotein [Sinirhodobacter populi]RWR10737.1 YjbF family lipoprotein [Sinirhodobacter populi]RWR32783.1 YjbF family lipoprotein [Sinirhodobacter populi]
MTPVLRRAVAGLLVAALAACGSDQSEKEGTELAAETAKGIVGLLPIPFLKKGGAPAAAPNAEAMALSAMETNRGPLILASFEAQGITTVLGMIGENGAMRTYATPSSQAMILRGGILAGTRGFGHDMISADVAAVGALIRGRTTGGAAKVLRFLDGLGLERPLPLTCAVRTGAESTYPFAGQSWTGTQVIEHCEGSGAVIDNSYIVGADGAIIASRQWISPQLGYVTIQTIRG